MSGRRRVGAETSETRARIVAAAEQVIRDDGYAACSTRRVAAHVGLKPSLVHYYFPTTDDLLLEVFRVGAAQSDAMIAAALADPDPMRALWRFFADESRTALSIEFIALARHRPAIRAEIARHGTDMRVRQAEAIHRRIGDRLGDTAPEAIGLILAAIGRTIIMETALGVEDGHAAARALVAATLDRLLAADGPGESA